MSVAVIVGSAFDTPTLGGQNLEPETMDTPWGSVVMYRYHGTKHPAYVLFRHGLPHRYLPSQIPYRALVHALHSVHCQALLVTSSVGVLVPDLPLFAPLLLGDLLMPDNRLPDGSACTMFVEPTAVQGHLVLEEGIFSLALRQQLQVLAKQLETPIAAEAIFAYVGGPRTKTPIENAYWAKMGAQVNSMTLAPEVVLANEYEIPTAGVVVGHKYSIPGHRNPFAQETIASSLVRSHHSMEQLVIAFLQKIEPPPFRNRIYRFDAQLHHSPNQKEKTR